MDNTQTTTTPRPGVLLVNRCFVLDATQQKILLIKRSRTDKHHPSLWEAPGGKLEQGQDLGHALEREVLEETGLLVENSQRLVYAQSEFSTLERYRGMLYLVLFGVASVIGGKLKLSEEHEDAAWATYDEALDYDLTPETRKALIVLEQQLKTDK